MAKATIMAEDMYYLSKLMKGKYLDYDYVSLMTDLSQRPAMKEAQSMDRLSDVGLIFEDFGGDIEIEGAAKELFEPIFFGTFESELVIEDHSSFQRYKYHVLDGRYVQVAMKGKELEISTIKKEDILNHTPYVEDLKEQKSHPKTYFENVMVEGILILKRIKFGGKSQVVQLVNDAGVYYKANGSTIHSVTKSELKKLMSEILWEE